MEVTTLADITSDTDGLEDYCIELGDQRYDDVSLAFQYIKGSSWNERMYDGLERSVIDNIDISFGKCQGDHSSSHYYEYHGLTFQRYCWF